MKRKIKFVYLTILGSLLCSCNVSYDDKSQDIGIKLTQLSTPRITQDSYNPETNTISWNSVANCDGYTIKIDDFERDVEGLTYIVSFEETKDFTFSIKARGKALYSSDSPWSETFSWRFTKKFIETNGNMLLTPTNVDYVENKITWDSVPYAVSYIIGIKESNSSEEIPYTRSKNYLDLEFNENTNFKYRIKAIADSSTNYEDSEWSAYFDGVFKKTTKDLTYNDEYKNKGLGRTVNLLSENGSYRKFETRVINPFDTEKLSLLKVGKRSLREGKVDENISYSYDEKVDESARDIDAKLSVSKIKPGLKKVVSQKSFGMNVSYQNKYRRRSSSKTRMYFYDLENEWRAEEYYFEEGVDKRIFTNALSNGFLNDALEIENDPNNEELVESFVRNYGTHLITSAIYGATLTMHYSLVGTEQGLTTQLENNGNIGLSVSKNFIEVEGSVGVDVSSNKFEQQNEVNINLNIDFLGGENQGFGTSFTEGDLSNFNNAYQNWAKSTNDPDYYSFIDVDDNSLICLWDLLDNTNYKNAKDALNNYLDKKASDAYYEAMKKLESLFDENYKDPELIDLPFSTPLYCADNNGYKYNASDKPDDSTRHDNWNLGKISVSGCELKDDKFTIIDKSQFDLTWTVLEDPDTLPKVNVSSNLLNSDTYNGKVNGTNINETIGYGAYWIRFNYKDNSQTQSYKVNFMNEASKGTKIPMISNLNDQDAYNSKKQLTSIEIVIVYETSDGGPGFLGIWWYESPNWRIEYTINFSN